MQERYWLGHLLDPAIAWNDLMDHEPEMDHWLEFSRLFLSPSGRLDTFQNHYRPHRTPRRAQNMSQPAVTEWIKGPSPKKSEVQISDPQVTIRLAN